MARIGPIKKVYAVPEPVVMPVFTKPEPKPLEAEPERELVPVRRAPARI